MAAGLQLLSWLVRRNKLLGLKSTPLICMCATALESTLLGSYDWAVTFGVTCSSIFHCGPTCRLVTFLCDLVHSALEVQHARMYSDDTVEQPEVQVRTRAAQWQPVPVSTTYQGHVMLCSCLLCGLDGYLHWNGLPGTLFSVGLLVMPAACVSC